MEQAKTFRHRVDENELAAQAIARHAARVAAQQQEWVVEMNIEGSPCRVTLSFDRGVGKLLLHIGPQRVELTSRQAEELAESLKEQAYNLRRVEG